MPNDVETGSKPGSAARPVIGMVVAFVVVVLIILVGARYLFAGHTASAPLSTAGSAVNETTAAGDAPTHR